MSGLSIGQSANGASDDHGAYGPFFILMKLFFLLSSVALAIFPPPARRPRTLAGVPAPCALPSLNTLVLITSTMAPHTRRLLEVLAVLARVQLVDPLALPPPVVYVPAPRTVTPRSRPATVQRPTRATEAPLTGDSPSGPALSLASDWYFIIGHPSIIFSPRRGNFFRTTPRPCWPWGFVVWAASGLRAGVVRLNAITYDSEQPSRGSCLLSMKKHASMLSLQSMLFMK